MTIVHIVLFEFKPTCELAVIEDVGLSCPISLNELPQHTPSVVNVSVQVCKRMLALKDACIHPTTKKPYIQTSVGGRDNSPEGHQVVVL